MKNKTYSISALMQVYSLDNAISGNPIRVFNNYTLPSLEFVEALYGIRIFQKCEFNITLTAKTLQISRSAMYRKIKLWKTKGFIVED